MGTAASLVLGLALNDLANPAGWLRRTWRQLMAARPVVRVIETGTRPGQNIVPVVRAKVDKED